jgi:phosphotransferase system HPr (HPr) family protein
VSGVLVRAWLSAFHLSELCRYLYRGAMNVVEGTVQIKNKLGLHLRAASTLAQTAARFSSTITLTRGKENVNARSVTGLMMLGAGIGTRLKVKVEGSDAEDAFKAIQAIFDQKFGEE